MSVSGGISLYIFFFMLICILQFFYNEHALQELGAGEVGEQREGMQPGPRVCRVRPHTDRGQNGEGLRVQHQELLVLSAQHQA